MNPDEIYIKITKDGPYLIYGLDKINEKIIISDENNIAIKYEDGKTYELKTSPAALCRCGKSKPPPFCDGTHSGCGFDGTETASFEPILKNAVKYEGKNLILYDNEKYCALARFCDAQGTIWNLIHGDNDELVIEEANHCPAGRLLVFDRQGNQLERVLEKSIDILEDRCYGISGPLWVKGGIRVESADGKSYEIRNKQTLCRCGNSKNKPFCDCTHKHINFNAERKD